MRTTEDVKIAEWLGWKWHPEKKSSMHDPYWSAPYGKAKGLPAFSTSDADAIQLLPVLVEKGYAIVMLGMKKGYALCIGFEHEQEMMDTLIEDTTPHPSIASAIVSAISELIEREGK